MDTISWLFGAHDGYLPGLKNRRTPIIIKSNNNNLLMANKRKSRAFTVHSMRQEISKNADVNVIIRSMIRN